MKFSKKYYFALTITAITLTTISLFSIYLLTKNTEETEEVDNRFTGDIFYTYHYSTNLDFYYDGYIDIFYADWVHNHSLFVNTTLTVSTETGEPLEIPESHFYADMYDVSFAVIQNGSSYVDAFQYLRSKPVIDVVLLNKTCVVRPDVFTKSNVGYYNFNIHRVYYIIFSPGVWEVVGIFKGDFWGTPSGYYRED